MKNRFALIALISALVPLCACTRKQAHHSAPSPVELTVTDSPGCTVPKDFTGISFETDAIMPGHRDVKGYFFRPSNGQLVSLFINSGLRSLRIGGSTVDRYHDKAYNREAIDSLFAFARVAGVKVIYSLPLLNAGAADAAATAKYIKARYDDCLDYFSIGNEPNCPPYKEAPAGAIHTYGEYLPVWKAVFTAVLDAVPDATFAGPDAGGWNWTEEFARDEANTGHITYITHHQYPGGRPFLEDSDVPMPAARAIDNMLSPEWLMGEYSFIFSRTGEKVHPYGLSCRMTEANDYLGGIDGASNAMSSALWALDYMHWQAARGLAGINFHNNQWLKTCTVYRSSAGEFRANPKAHAIRAFDMISGGRVEPVAIANPDSINLTAYAVKDSDYLYITVINKEHGTDARDVQAAISAKDFTKGKASAMYLAAPGNDAGATAGITLGGDSITNNRPWQGRWTAIKKKSAGQYTVDIAKSSAVIVRIPAL